MSLTTPIFNIVNTQFSRLNNGQYTCEWGFIDQFHNNCQQSIVWLGNTCFSFAIRGCQMVADKSLGCVAYLAIVSFINSFHNHVLYRALLFKAINLSFYFLMAQSY